MIEKLKELARVLCSRLIGGDGASRSDLSRTDRRSTGRCKRCRNDRWIKELRIYQQLAESIGDGRLWDDTEDKILEAKQQQAAFQWHCICQNKTASSRDDDPATAYRLIYPAAIEAVDVTSQRIF